MSQRSHEDRLEALTAMFRVRTTETPPDADGERMIWHQGAQGAYLVTAVEATGRVTSQQLTLFDDQISWNAIDGLTTGSRASGTGAVIDASRDPAKVSRVLDAFDSYGGNDPYLLHMHRLLEAAAGRKVPLAGADPVTRPAQVVSEDLRKKARALLDQMPPNVDPAPRGPAPGKVLHVVGIAVLGTLIVVLLGMIAFAMKK